MMTKEQKLKEAWVERCRLTEEGHKLTEEGHKLRADGFKLCADGDNILAEAIIEVYGDMKITWLSQYRCKLANGMEFKHE